MNSNNPSYLILWESCQTAVYYNSLYKAMNNVVKDNKNLIGEMFMIYTSISFLFIVISLTIGLLIPMFAKIANNNVYSNVKIYVTIQPPFRWDDDNEKPFIFTVLMNFIFLHTDSIAIDFIEFQQLCVIK